MRTIWNIEDAAGFRTHEVFDIDTAYGEYVGSIPADDRRGIFHPSAIGMCARRNVYEFICAPFNPNTLTAELRETFDHGHKVHDLVQGRLEGVVEHLRAKGYHANFIREVPYDPNTDVLYQDFNVGGTCDGILEVGRDGWMQRGVIEVKSIAAKSYAKLTGPKTEHYDQSTIYAYRFGLPIIWVWYFNKDREIRRVIPTRFDATRMERILRKYILWNQHAAEGTLPDREESTFNCPTCPYQDTCRPNVLLSRSKVAPLRAQATPQRFVPLRRSR